MGGAPTATSAFVQRIVISVGDAAVSNNASVCVSTYALGSCVGVLVYDPVTTIGGLLHAMLPEAKLSPDKAATQPSLFVDTGLEHLLITMEGLGALLPRSKIYVGGAATIMCQNDTFKIGERNATTVMAILKKRGLNPIEIDIGGVHNRTLHFKMGSGELEIKTPIGIKKILLK